MICEITSGYEKKRSIETFMDSGSRGEAGGFCMIWWNFFDGAGMGFPLCQIEVRENSQRVKHLKTLEVCLPFYLYHFKTCMRL